MSITNSQSLFKLMSVTSVVPSNDLILCCPLLLPPSIFPSIRVFLNESVLYIRWPKYWSFSFSISHSNEYSGLISFRMDWLDLLAVQGTLKTLLQHHSSKKYELWTLALSFLYSPTLTSIRDYWKKKIALTRCTITADGDCSNEIKRQLLLGRKVMTNLDSILKSRVITLPTEVCLVKAMVFPVVMYGCELDCEESWALKNWCFWTVVLEKILENPLDCKEIHPVHPKWDQSWVFIGRTDAEAETPVLWPPHAKSWLIGKDPDAGRDWGQEDKGMTEDETAGWHHRLDRHEFE